MTYNCSVALGQAADEPLVNITCDHIIRRENSQFCERQSYKKNRIWCPGAREKSILDNKGDITRNTAKLPYWCSLIARVVLLRVALKN